MSLYLLPLAVLTNFTRINSVVMYVSNKILSLNRLMDRVQAKGFAIGGYTA